MASSWPKQVQLFNDVPLGDCCTLQHSCSIIQRTKCINQPSFTHTHTHIRMDGLVALHYWMSIYIDICNGFLFRVQMWPICISYPSGKQHWQGLGLSSGEITKGQISVSSSLEGHEKNDARLYYRGSWCADHRRDHHYIQVSRYGLNTHLQGILACFPMYEIAHMQILTFETVTKKWPPEKSCWKRGHEGYVFDNFAEGPTA